MKLHTVYLQDVLDPPLLLIRCRLSRHFSPGDTAPPELSSPDQIVFFLAGTNRYMHLTREMPLLLIRRRVSRHFSSGDPASVGQIDFSLFYPRTHLKYAAIHSRITKTESLCVLLPSLSLENAPRAPSSAITTTKKDRLCVFLSSPSLRQTPAVFVFVLSLNKRDALYPYFCPYPR
jgi:hypothetical protein